MSLIPRLLTFGAGFFRAHSMESMTRLMAFGWFVVSAGYVLFKVTPDPILFGVMSANCLTCLGLRKSPTAEAKADG